MKTILTRNIIFVLIIGATLIVQLYFSTRYRLMAREAQLINQDYRQLNLDNQEYASQIAELTSLSSVEKKAKGLGFTLGCDTIYLPSGQQLAHQP